MTDPRDIWVAGFCTGAAFIGALAGWFGPTERTNNGLWNKQQLRGRARDRDRDRDRDPDWRRSFNHENTNRPSGPPPLRLQRGGSLGTQPLILNEGRTIRGNGLNAPTTPKPDIIPKPQFPSPRIIRDDFLP